MLDIPQLLTDFRWTQTKVSVGLTTTQLLAQNPNRWALLVDVQSGNNMLVSTNEQFGPGEGIQISNSRPFLELDFRTVGGLVCSSWWAVGMGGATNATVIEVLYLPYPHTPGGQSDLLRAAQLLNGAQ